MAHLNLEAYRVLFISGSTKVSITVSPLAKFKLLSKAMQTLLLFGPTPSGSTVTNMYTINTSESRTFPHVIHTTVNLRSLKTSCYKFAIQLTVPCRRRILVLLVLLLMQDKGVGGTRALAHSITVQALYPEHERKLSFQPCSIYKFLRKWTNLRIPGLLPKSV